MVAKHLAVIPEDGRHLRIGVDHILIVGGIFGQTVRKVHNDAVLQCAGCAASIRKVGDNCGIVAGGNGNVHLLLGGPEVNFRIVNGDTGDLLKMLNGIQVLKIGKSQLTQGTHKVQLRTHPGQGQTVLADGQRVFVAVVQLGGIAAGETVLVLGCRSCFLLGAD